MLKHDCARVGRAVFYLSSNCRMTIWSVEITPQIGLLQEKSPLGWIQIPHHLLRKVRGYETDKTFIICDPVLWKLVV